VSRSVRRVDAVAGVLIWVILNAVATIFIVRLLGAAGRGEMVALTLVPTIVHVLFGLGLPAANVFHAARAAEKAGALAANTIIASVLMPALAFAVSFVVPSAWLTLGKIGLPANEIRAAILLAPALLAFQQLAGVSQGLSRYDTVRRARTAQGFVLLALLIGVSFTDVRSPFVFFLFWIASYASAAGVIAFGIARATRLRPSFGTFRVSLRYGVRAMWTQLWEFVNLRGDQVLVAMMGSSTALGLYSLAVSLSEVLLHIPNALSMVVFSDTATPELRRSRAEVKREAWLAFVLTAAGGAVLVVGMWLLAEPVLQLKPAEVVPLLAVMVIPVAALAAGRMLAGLLMGEGRPELPSLAAGVSVAVTFALDIALVPRIGAMGAAIGVSAGYLSSAVVMLGTYTITGRAARWGQRHDDAEPR